MGLQDAILSLAPNFYLPMQEAAGATLPAIVPRGLTLVNTGGCAPAQVGPSGDTGWSTHGSSGVYLQIPDSAGLRFTGSAFSVCCCTYLLEAGSFKTLMGKTPSGGGGTHEWLLRLNSTTGFNWWLSQNGNGNPYVQAAGGPTPTVGVLYYLVGSWDGTTARIIVNGVQGGSSTSTTGTPSAGTSNEVRVGDYQGTGNTQNISHVGFWQRGLSVAEALSIYNAGVRNRVVSCG
jgi:hypothetical protein